MQRAAPSTLTGDSELTYAIDGELGRGGMGVVYEGHDPAGTKVAIKVLRDAQLDARFAREASTVRRLSHPGVVRLLDHGRDDHGTPFLVLEFLRGQPLDAFLSEHPKLRLGWAEVVRLLEHLLAALEAVHALDIVHRDIKPSNVFLTDAGDVKLLDFGIARIRSATQQRMTKTGDLFGTAEYMSPEQCKGLPTIDHRSDLYSVGILAYELLTGAPPFRADAPLAVLNMQLNEAPPPLPDVVDVPKPLETLLWAALAKEPTDRPASAASMLDALAELPRPEPVAPTLALPASVSRTPKRHPTEPAFVADAPKAPPEPAPPRRGSFEDISPADDRVHEEAMGTRFHVESSGGRGPLRTMTLGVGVVAVAVTGYVVWPRDQPAPQPLVVDGSVAPFHPEPDLGGAGEPTAAKHDVGSQSDPLLVPEPRTEREEDLPETRAPITEVDPVEEPATETPLAETATCGGALNCFNKGRNAADVYAWGVAFLYFRRGCARGGGPACFEMAQVLRSHRGDIPPDHTRGTSVIGALEAGCKLQRPDARSCLSAGFAFLHALHGVAKDRDKAMWRLARSCQAGDERGCEIHRCESDDDAAACLAFGSRYARAEGRDPNAETYMMRGCDLHLGEACTKYADYVLQHRNNYLPTDTPSSDAVEMYEKGCEYDDLAGCQALSEIYANNDGYAVEADPDKAAAYRARACELGATGCQELDVGPQASPTGVTDGAAGPDVGAASAPE